VSEAFIKCDLIIDERMGTHAMSQNVVDILRGIYMEIPPLQ